MRDCPSGQPCKPLWRGPGTTPICTRAEHYGQPATAPAPAGGAR